MWRMLPMRQQQQRHNNGREKKETEIVRLLTSGPDQRGAEAFLQTLGKEFKRDRENPQK